MREEFGLEIQLKNCLNQCGGRFRHFPEYANSLCKTKAFIRLKEPEQPGHWKTFCGNDFEEVYTQLREYIMNHRA